MLKPMLKAIKSIIIFLISISLVLITSYLYIYKGFIDITEKNKIIYKENIINKTIKEKTYNIIDLLHKQQEKEYHGISDLILDFLNKTDNQDFEYKLHFTLKKEGLTQLNNMLNTPLFIPDTINDIYINIVPLINNELEINIYGEINSKEIIIKGIYSKDDNTIILNYFKVDGFLSLINDQGYSNFTTDSFKIKYGEIIGKKISLENFVFPIIDYTIPESKINDIEAFINGIENFVKLNNDKEFYFIFSDKLKNTSNEIKTYILTNKNLSLGQKQSLLIDILKLTKKLNNTEIDLTSNQLKITNTDSLFLFDYNLTISKIKPRKSRFLDNLEIDNDFKYNINEIIDILLVKNKLLVKYLNGEDLLFLIQK